MLRQRAIGCLILTLSAVTAWADELPRHSVNERYPGVDVVYDSVRPSGGHALRVIVTHPHSGSQPLPVVFVVGWLSCNSVEAPAGSKDATGQVFQALAQMPGFVTVRVDKPGVGDSQGSCPDADFESELAGYRAAFRALSRYPFIDMNAVFMLGISNGAGFAPLVAEGAPVRGYIVNGGWVKTWFEHMLEIERRRLTLGGKSPGDVNTQMKSVERFYSAYLLEGVPPREILREHPEWASLWDADLDHQYGRPIVFYQQLQKLNLAEAWSHVSVPALVLQGEFDWIMSREDHELIAAFVNHNAPGAARFVTLPSAGHSFDHFASMEDSFRFRDRSYDPAVEHLLVDWLEQHRPGGK